jgi:putative membrane protein insertion efficiency factor
MIKRLILFALKVYRVISVGMRPRCRFWPSCSEYASQAVETHGAARGLWLTSLRILRCHPFGGHGVDPVPSQFHIHKGLSPS